MFNRTTRRTTTATRRLIQAACARPLEQLEPRQLFAANPVPELADKIDPRFYQAAVDVDAGRGNAWVRNGVCRVDTANRLETYLTVDDDPALDAELRRLGVVPQLGSAATGLIQAWIPADQFDEVGAIPAVQRLEAPVYAVSNLVTSAGDGVLKADKVRAQFAALGIDGTGLKIGVISDGAEDRASVAAELPTVTVHPTIQAWNVPGTCNEGTAMMEIVHDLAPGAQFFFAGPDTAVEMSTSIDWMVAQGCDIIVDDLAFFDQGFFTDTGIAASATSAISQGVVYVSAAGNFSSKSHYQGVFNQSMSAAHGGRLHQFAVGNSDLNLNINNGADFRAFLQWSDVFNDSDNDYNLYMYDTDTFDLLDSSETVQDGVGVDKPFEMLSWKNTTGATVHASIWIVRKTGEDTREFELFTLGNSTLEFETQGDAIFGHQAASGVMAVAATAADNGSTVEAFSSRGNSTIYTNLTDAQVKVTRQSLDGTATDKVQTKIGQLGTWPHNPFYGTSAAAPHAAAIAALVLQTKNSLTPAQVLQVMADTATDVHTAGYDVHSGAGLYNALDAVYAVFTPTAPDLTAPTDTGSSNTDNLTNDATPTFTGTVPLGSYVRLFVDGVEAAAAQLGAAVGTYSLTPGSALSDGPHNITIRVASSAAVPLAENSSPSAPLVVTVDTAAPTLSNVAFTYDAPGQRLTYTFSEDVSAGLPAGAIDVFNLTTSTHALHQLDFAPGNKAVITFPAYTYGALPDGNYHASIAGVTDAAGNLQLTGLDHDFFVYAGDANLDRTVDFNDLVTLSQNYNTAGGMTWATGDFTADGNVDFNDLVLLSQHYNTTLPDPGASLVLDPAPALALATAPKKSNASIFNTTVPIAPPRPAYRPASTRAR